MRVLISGGRFFRERAKILAVIQDLAANGDTLIHGHCHKGADAIADELAAKFGIRMERYPADWSIGHGAGHVRNQQMIDTGIDFAYFFWDGMSPGTHDCLKRAIKAGIPHKVISAEGCSEIVHRAYQELSPTQGELFLIDSNESCGKLIK